MKFFKLLIVTICLIPAYAFAMPAYPMAFWGNVKIDTVEAPVGTIITAYDASSLVLGTVTVTETGVYGYDSPLLQKLLVAEGIGLITFKVTSPSFNSGLETTGTDVQSYASFSSGITVNKDLHFRINTTAPANHTISGTVKYYDGIKVISNALVTLTTNTGTQIATTTTNASGTYQFNGVIDGGSYVVGISKSEGATGLSSADQIKIGRHIVGVEPFSSIYKTIAGDVNNSGSLSSSDQIKIGRFIVGLDSNLISGSWKFYSSEAVLTTSNYLTTGMTRVYSNLTNTTSTQDFVGVKMGDVNNSWISN